MLIDAALSKRNADADTVLLYLQKKQRSCSENAEMHSIFSRSHISENSISDEMPRWMLQPLHHKLTETWNARTEKLSERKLQELASWSRQRLGHCLILTHVLIPEPPRSCCWFVPFTFPEFQYQQSPAPATNTWNSYCGFVHTTMRIKKLKTNYGMVVWSGS